MLDLLKDKRVKISSDIELKDRLVGIQRVVKVTKGGRAFGFSAIEILHEPLQKWIFSDLETAGTRTLLKSDLNPTKPEHFP